MNDSHFEIEKKFLIQRPDTEFLKSCAGCNYDEIEQIYLVNSDGESERIRMRGKNGEYLYYHTLKKHITNIKRIEKENLITKDEYDALKKRADPKLSIIYKTRYCIPYEGHTLEIDIFPFWSRQAFLEIELTDEKEKFLIPDYIDVIKDVTDDRSYTNRSLARSIPDEIQGNTNAGSVQI